MTRKVMIGAALVATVAFTLTSHWSEQPWGAIGGTREPAAAPAKVPLNAPVSAVDPDSFYQPKRLAAGQRPPQFVVVSFDGVGSHEKWEYWRSVADRAGARFTGFLSGVYLVDSAHRTAYHGPGHRPGRSSLGQWYDPDQVQLLVTDLNLAWAKGFELGTHFNGHFCASDPPGANNWSTSDWNNELDQFFQFFRDYRSIDQLPAAPNLVVPPASIVGGRTPCLEGRPARLFPALKAHGFQYDSSGVADGIAWPRKNAAGLWEFPLPYVPLAGSGRGVISMDYNFWVRQTGSPPSTRDPKADSGQVLRTYQAMYRASYDGNRAPLVLGNHFNSWNGNAYTMALARFVTDVCRAPDTYCVPYRDVIRWMQAQDPAMLAQLQSQPAVDTVG
jgi:hypothetical protein